MSTAGIPSARLGVGLEPAAVADVAAVGAVGVTDVVEHGRFPIFGVVTGSALKMVVGSWIVFQVAGNTVVVADVIKCSLSPIFCVAVTVGTGARFAGFVGCLEGVANTYDWKGSME